jgi:hypothetical protein
MYKIVYNLVITGNITRLTNVDIQGFLTIMNRTLVRKKIILRNYLGIRIQRNTKALVISRHLTADKRT